MNDDIFEHLNLDNSSSAFRSPLHHDNNQNNRHRKKWEENSKIRFKKKVNTSGNNSLERFKFIEKNKKLLRERQLENHALNIFPYKIQKTKEFKLPFLKESNDTGRDNSHRNNKTFISKHLTKLMSLKRKKCDYKSPYFEKSVNDNSQFINFNSTKQSLNFSLRRRKIQPITNFIFNIIDNFSLKSHVGVRSSQELVTNMMRNALYKIDLPNFCGLSNNNSSFQLHR